MDLMFFHAKNAEEMREYMRVIFNLSASEKLKEHEFSFCCKLQKAHETLFQFCASYKNPENIQNPYGFYNFHMAKKI